MNKILKIIGVYFLTIFAIFSVKYLTLWLYSRLSDYDMFSSDYVIFSSGIYSLVGLVGVCTYILYTKNK